MDQSPDIAHVHCNGCHHETRHQLLRRHEQHGSEGPDDEPWWTTIFEMFECSGCSDVTLRRTFYFFTWDEDEAEISYYPPRVSRREPSFLDQLSPEIRSLLREVYAALHADSRWLAMIGARTMVDMLMVQQVGDVGTFAQKLDALEKSGLIGRTNRQTLSAALDVGHAAIHRGFSPDGPTTSLVMDVIEHLLQASIHAGSAEWMRERTPRRPDS